MTPTILIAEDEESIVALMRLYLDREGFTVQVSTNGDDAITMARECEPDLIILDIGLPGRDGLEVCRALRAVDDWTPVLFVTARDDEVDRVVGLELGADDYVTKPFSPRELVARVKAILRRADIRRDGAPVPREGRRGDSRRGSQGVEGAGRQTLAAGVVRLDVGRRLVWAGERRIDLTATEFDLLAHLMKRVGQVYSRDQLLAEVWGYPEAGSRTVDVHVAQLRAKLGASSPIRTVRGVGYAVDG